MAGRVYLKVLGTWPSPFVTRVKLALALKGLSYEDVEEDLYKKSELLLKSNPVHKKIPVLIHNGAPVCESMIILQYIDEVFADTGQSLLPADPYERATARFWADFIANTCLKPLWQAMWTDGEEQARLARETKESLWVLDAQLEGKRFFGGDALGFVDLAACTLAHWLGVLEEVAGVRLMKDGEYPALRR